MHFEKQLNMPVKYKEILIESGFRLDILIEDKVITELKSVETLLSVHKAQLKTYLKLSNHWLGLLLNFNSAVMKNGTERIVWG